MSRRSLAKRLWYDYLHVACRVGAVVVFRVRCSGREHVPPQGGGLVLSNHQSQLDPVLVGLACDRRLNFLARKSLFRFPPFRWLIDSLNAIPIDRDGTGLGGLKETLKRLKDNELVLIFPEGTRTNDGQVAPLKPGFLALAKRAGALIPVAVDGAFDAWPKCQKLPGRAMIQIVFGPPIMPDVIQWMTDEQILAEVERRIRACHARASLGRIRAKSQF